MNIILEILRDFPFVSETFKIDLYPSTNIMLQTESVLVRLFSKYQQDARLPKCQNYFNRLQSALNWLNIGPFTESGDIRCCNNTIHLLKMSMVTLEIY